MREKKTNRLLAILSIAALLLSGCKSIPIKNKSYCAVAGVMQAGMNCAESLSTEKYELTFEEMIDFLEPQSERKDPKTGKTLPARAGAICQSAEDATQSFTELDQACRALGSACSYEVKEVINKMGASLESTKKKSFKEKK